MTAARFMVDALQNNIVFYLDGGNIRMSAPDDVRTNHELMQLIKSHKQGIIYHLKHGFSCVRDKITFKERRELMAACKITQ